MSTLHQNSRKSVRFFCSTHHLPSRQQQAVLLPYSSFSQNSFTCFPRVDGRVHLQVTAMRYDSGPPHGVGDYSGNIKGGVPNGQVRTDPLPPPPFNHARRFYEHSSSAVYMPHAVVYPAAALGVSLRMNGLGAREMRLFSRVITSASYVSWPDRLVCAQCIVRARLLPPCLVCAPHFISRDVKGAENLESLERNIEIFRSGMVMPIVDSPPVAVVRASPSASQTSLPFCVTRSIDAPHVCTASMPT